MYANRILSKGGAMRKRKKSAWYYIKKYKFSSLLIKNFGFILAVVVVPILLVVSVNYRKFNKEVNNRMMYMNEELLQKSAVVIDNVMYSIIELMEQMVNENDVTLAMEKEYDKAYEETTDNVISIIQRYTQINQYIKKVYIYSNINNQIIDSMKAQDARRYMDKGKWYYIYKNMPMNSMCVLADGEQSILFCQPIDTQKQDNIGVVVFEIDLQKIGELLEKEGILQSGIFFIVDLSGRVMYCSHQDYDTLSQDIKQEYKNHIGRTKMGETRYTDGDFSEFVSVVESEYKSWKYALIKGRATYEEENSTVRDFLFSAVSISFLTSILVSYIITTITYQPIKRIVEAIEKPEQYLNSTEESKRSNELMYITSNILNTLSHREEIHKELETRMEALRKAQTLALQFQMDPHFLYNTLETIKWSAIEEIGVGNKVSKLITKTAKLYRTTLESDDIILTLKKELDFLGLYIDILKARYDQQIQFLWDIDENLYECNVIKMCIQPLVENAVSHGLRNTKYCGTIAVLAYRESDKLCIAVENDGQGMSESKMKTLNEELQDKYEFDGTRVGLRNINERIKLIYGNEYGASIHWKDEAEKIGTRVVITFPCR